MTMAAKRETLTTNHYKFFDIALQDSDPEIYAAIEQEYNRQHYHIEITGSEHELRAEYVSKDIASLLKIPVGFPILHISVKFHTSRNNFSIYSELYCNTKNYPIGNNYNL